MTNWLALLKQYIGYQGATSLADKITAARAGYLDNINNAQLLNISAARLGYIDRLTLLAAGGAGELTLARVGYLDNINNAQLLNITAARLGYIDNLSGGAVALAASWTAGLAAILANFTALRIGYLDNLSAGAVAQAATALSTAQWTNAIATALASYTAARAGYLDNINNAQLLNITAARLGYIDNLSGGAVALEASLTAIKGAGWATETLVAIMAAIGTIAGVNTYQEIIPDIDFSKAAIPEDLASDPPAAPAANSIVDIDQNAGDTFVLRSLFVNVTAFGTAGTKLIFKLWTMLNAAVTMVDSVNVTSLGIQNLADIFGLQEVYGDGIWITVQSDATPGADNAACAGTYKYAKAS